MVCLMGTVSGRLFEYSPKCDQGQIPTRRGARKRTSYATVGVLPGSMKLVPIQGEADFSREDLANRQKILNGFVMRGRLGDR